MLIKYSETFVGLERNIVGGIHAGHRPKREGKNEFTQKEEK